MRSLNSSSPSGEWATISPIKTKKNVFFSIRWKILIAFLLILGVAFYTVATLLINLVGDYLFNTKISSETAAAIELATNYAPMFAEGDAEGLFQIARREANERYGRILLIDMDGKVQLDTASQYNGWRFAHPEVLSVLNGAASDHGFHLISSSTKRENRAFFDFLRKDTSGESWGGYFSAQLRHNGEQQGVLLLSVNVQDMVDELRVIQDQMLMLFVVAAAAVLVMSLVFSRVITKPIDVLNEGIERMGRGDLSGRVKVTGNDEMARLGETFNQMSEKLENLDTSRNEFVSNASHELKTPLATMKIMLESMIYQEDMDPALRTEFLSDMNSELDRLSKIVTDLLTLVQSDSHEYKPSRVDVLLGDLAEDTLHRLEPLAKEREQSLTLTVQGDVLVNVDINKIQQAIYNLVDNAIKYSPQGGKVRVIVKQDSKDAILEVTDNGQGIPKKDQAHIFDRFYRVDRARARATGGNGLGLSIVHQAVVMHGGSVSVRSEEGKGSTFRMELPLAT